MQRWRLFQARRFAQTLFNSANGTVAFERGANHNALTMLSDIFLASPKSIIVLSR